MKNITSLDLNLLAIFDALASEMNTTKAAKRLNLSQPAVSHALNRLREMIGDELFVRSSKGMVATPRAKEMIGPIREILSKIENVIDGAQSFDPLQAEREFRISTTDLTATILFPKMIEYLSNESPKSRVVIRPTAGQLPKEELESGSLDFAIAGFYGELPEGFYQQTLFKDDFVCIARAGHPSFSGNFSLKKYSEARHILISLDGDMKAKSAAILAKKGLEQFFVVGTFSFLLPAWILSETDALLTCPRTLALSYCRKFPYEIKELPFEMPTISVSQVWHARNHKDPAHEWCRKLIKKICLEI